MTLGATRIKTEHMDAKIVQPVDMPDLGFPIARPVVAVNMLHHQLYLGVVLAAVECFRAKTQRLHTDASYAAQDIMSEKVERLLVKVVVEVISQYQVQLQVAKVVVLDNIRTKILRLPTVANCVR